MKIPKHIGVYGIQATIFGLLNKAFPHLHFIFHFPLAEGSWEFCTGKPDLVRKYGTGIWKVIPQGYFWDSEWSQKREFSSAHQ